MKRTYAMIILIAGAVAYSAICIHSVQEIHYLKSFFPSRFSVEDAFFAAAVELIKVIIIGIPFILWMVLSVFFTDKQR